MKTRTFLTGLLLMCFYVSFGAELQVESNSHPDIQVQVQNMIKDHLHKFRLQEDVVARVEFTVNDLNQIVVLETDCTDSRIDSFIKKVLNYKKIEGSLDPVYTRCIIPIRFEKGNFT